MNPTPEFVAMMQREREREIHRDYLARLAARARACCDLSFVRRLARALRGTPATC